MSVALLRIFIFTMLPILFALLHNTIDKTASNRERRLEVFLLYLFALGVAANGIGGFIGHVFISDPIAESIGWPGGNPFQLEVGFANLALGIMGIIAMGRRDGFREATVIAVTVFSVGATIVHVMDILATGNLAFGNTLQNISNLARPALLIGFLVATHKAEKSTKPEVNNTDFRNWQASCAQMAGYTAGIVAAGFGLGFGTGWPVMGTAAGILCGIILLVLKNTYTAK